MKFIAFIDICVVTWLEALFTPGLEAAPSWLWLACGTTGIGREGSIKDFYQRRPLQSLHSDLGEMRFAITLTLLFVSSAFAAPQFEGIKNLFSSLATGDQDEESGTEKVPYTTLKQFDVSSDLNFSEKRHT